MLSLLKIELIKVKRYRPFWMILAIYALLLFLSSGAIAKLTTSSPLYSFFAFPDVWHNLSYVASYLNVLLGILMIMLIANEFTFRTFRQNLIDGLSRKELIYSKMMMVASVAAIAIGFIFILGLIRGILTGHFVSIGEMYERIYYLFYLFVQMAGYMSLAVLVVLIFKRAAFSIVIYTVYVVAFERLVRWMVTDEIDRFFPMKIIGGVIPDIGGVSLDGLMESASLPQEWVLILAILYVIGFFSASLLLMEKSDL